MTSRRNVCLIFLALLAALVCSLTIGAAPLFARGDIHIVLVVSTTDPDARDANLIWKERIEGALSGEIDESYFNALQQSDRYSQPAERLGGLGKRDVATYKVLEGDDARPANILKVCRDVSMKAGVNDAIAVFIVSHGGIVSDNDGAKSHVLLPTGSRIERRSIMSALKFRKHRLIVLVTDSCSVSLTSNAKQMAEQSAYIPEILPKRDCYLKMFLTEAEGDVNINSTDYGETAEFLTDAKYNTADNIRAGTRFSSAFVKFATNGYYLDDELNPQDFYRLLSLELTREVNDFNRAMLTSCKQTLTSFDDNGRRASHDSFAAEDYFEINDNRFKAMTESGEFPENDGKKTFIRNFYRAVF